VLNGTTAEGLAHRLAASLQQSGYSQAAPLDGTPPGTHQTTVVEYTAGHHAEAAQVAQALSVSTVQPMEASVSALVGSSTVVVIAGLDKAGSTGEASSGAAGGEATP
jgi:LytR cell envelope-related transcriptional attenuator